MKSANPLKKPVIGYIKFTLVFVFGTAVSIEVISKSLHGQKDFIVLPWKADDCVLQI